MTRATAYTALALAGWACVAACVVVFFIIIGGLPT